MIMYVSTMAVCRIKTVMMMIFEVKKMGLNTMMVMMKMMVVMILILLLLVLIIGCYCGGDDDASSNRREENENYFMKWMNFDVRETIKKIYKIFNRY